MTKKPDDLVQGLRRKKLLADDEVAVYPANRFEIDALDQNRVVLTVHYFPTPDDYAKNQSASLKFLVPVSGVAPLANLLNLVLRELKEETSGRTH